MYMPSDPSDMLKTDENTAWLSVVGVVDEVRFDDLAGNRNQAGAYYFPYTQNPTRTVNLTVQDYGGSGVAGSDPPGGNRRN